MHALCLALAAASLVLASSQYSEGSPRYEQHQVQGEGLLTEQLASHPDLSAARDDDRNNHHVPEAAGIENAYRESFPAREDYVIDLLVNPCGANGTYGGVGGDALGYDCCMDQFGRGEYGLLKSVDETAAVHVGGGQNDSTSILRGLRVSASRVLAGPDEVLHNVILVDEDGERIPDEYSRRADDETVIDEGCRGLRDPHPSCVRERLRAVRSKLMPPCTDNNQTVDATLDCYSPDGRRGRHCMQVSYFQSSFIHVCGGDFADDDRCGTFIEIHRQNGSPYDHENVPLAEAKLTKRVTNGMSTTTIPLMYKGDPSRVMCSYQETKIRVGSMVRITGHSPTCCCPPAYGGGPDGEVGAGSYLCPRAPRTRDGPFAPTAKTLRDRIEAERHEESEHPLSCHLLSEDEDALMCSKRAGGGGVSEYYYPTEVGRDAEVSGRLFSYPCEAVAKIGDENYGSKDLDGQYDEMCPLGEAFRGCALASANSEFTSCIRNDTLFSFEGEAGKVVKVPSSNSNGSYYDVTFNDGRTVYSFAEHELEVLIFDNTYELWFVQRNRFEKIVQKKKSLRVLWPRCSFDTVNDRYFPFAQLDERGEPMSVFSEYDGDVATT